MYCELKAISPHQGEGRFCLPKARLSQWKDFSAPQLGVAALAARWHGGLVVERSATRAQADVLLEHQRLATVHTETACHLRGLDLDALGFRLARLADPSPLLGAKLHPLRNDEEYFLGIFLVAFYLKKIGGQATFIAAIVAELTVLACYAFTKIPYLWFNVIGCLIVVALAAAMNPFFQAKKMGN